MSGDGVVTERRGDRRKDRRSGKRWYKSKTIWANAVLGGLAAAETYASGAVSPSTALGIAVINGILRAVTKERLER